jgi:tubulin polyglutamylase TTLL6/13
MSTLKKKISDHNVRNVSKQQAKRTSTSLAVPKKEEAVEKPKQKSAAEFEANLQDKIILNAREIRYDIIKHIAKKTFGWRITRFKPDKETGSTALTHAKADFDVLWLDSDFHIDRLKGLKPYQKINHFPGMTIISLKNNLAKYLKLMQKQMPQEFGFFPKSWIFPYESYELQNFVNEKKKPIQFIVKPINSCQGKGIFLTRKIKDIPRDQGCVVVQQYKAFPYLIDKRKFDFRIYVLVTQVTPELQCFLYHDGLTRFATDEYSKNMNDDNLFMHLTNYAINKESEKFQENEADFKKTLQDTLGRIRDIEGESVVNDLMA